MSEVKQCDKCGSIEGENKWRHSPRLEVTYKQTTKAATAYSPSKYELCESCTRTFFDVFMNGEQ
jgi:hypothetical protein